MESCPDVNSVQFRHVPMDSAKSIVKQAHEELDELYEELVYNEEDRNAKPVGHGFARKVSYRFVKK